MGLFCHLNLRWVQTSCGDDSDATKNIQKRRTDRRLFAHHVAEAKSQRVLMVNLAPEPIDTREKRTIADDSQDNSVASLQP